MYFTTENCEITKVLPVIAVPITNDVSKEDMNVTEVIKVMYPNYSSMEDKTTKAETLKASSEEGWSTVTMKRGRQVTAPGHYDPATRKTVTWNMTVTEVAVDSEKSEEKNEEKNEEKSEETVNTGYYDIFKVTDRDEIATIAVNRNLYYELANVGASIDGGFENTQELAS